MKKVISVILAIILSLALFGCSDMFENKIVYPDYPETPKDNKESWEHDNSDITINWYVNYSWFSYPSSGSDVISRKIKEKTGFTVKFTSPITDDGQMLSTMIAGEALPDVISVQAWQPQPTQLALENYVYPLNELATRWAPKLLDRIEPDIEAYYKLGDGNLYGLPSCAYSSKYVMPEDKWAPNGGMMVRKDWLDWYLSQPDKMDITTPAGLKDAMAKVKAQFQGTTAGKVKNMSSLLLDVFNGEGNLGVNWFTQYFAAPFENAQGEYIDVRTSSQYKEALSYLNDCYRAEYIRKSNLSANTDEIAGILSRGEAFISLATPQNYPGSFINAYNNGVEYVPLYVRNSAGDDPVLQDLTGNGFVLNMISSKTKRPDKIIKLFDFLYSEEGQRLCQFGIEGDTWQWANAEKSQIKWTDKYLDMKKSGSLDSYGFGKFNTFFNNAYIEPISPLEGKTKAEAYMENLKRPLMPYSYRFTAAWPKLDVTKPEYLDIVKNESKVMAIWGEYLPGIISANSASASVNVYEEAISAMDRRGRKSVIDFYGEAYKSNKQKLNIDWGFPLNNPNYVSPTMRNPDGTFSQSPILPNGDNYYLRQYSYLN